MALRATLTPEERLRQTGTESGLTLGVGKDNRTALWTTLTAAVQHLAEQQLGFPLFALHVQ